MMALTMAGMMVFLGTKIVAAGMTAVDYYNRGIDAYQKGTLDKAIVNYTKAIELKPDFAFAYSNRGAAYDNKGDYDKAIADYNKAIKINPKDADIYNNRGNTYTNKGAYDKAIADFTRAIELKPDFAIAYSNRGNACKDKGAYDKAISDYTKAIKLNPKDADTRNKRGNTYVKKSAYDKAIADFTRAIKLKPNFANAYNNLAWLLATCPMTVYRNGARAVTLAEKAVTLSGGKNTNILDTLAAACAEAGRFNKAVETQRRAIRILRARSARAAVIVDYEKRLHGYEAHKPWRE